ncbi:MULTISPECIES: glycosyltransferase family 4 protein [unclassified Methylophaga]|jgi:glycosyltransferase involved in cell wall biosynthesis|uniref:glycosyltransferase family 4 protein n=1 Tax=unclassified Methylophaga TaxID=2629249 RepID=UPI00259D2941|nr:MULTISPECIES: glycosyltransferase family 4 protein [unclassified Methylophaga]|tara:strand:- start:4179 stop:5204 length:1026 start_codon:yes stop_codon:yes gene_type:complete
MNHIYYVIPDLFQKERFSFRSAVRHLKRRRLFNYIRRCLFRKFKPVGGVKVIYQHCLMLNKAGYRAYPVLMGKYHGNFFGFDVPTLSYQEALEKMGMDDIVVATEFAPYQAFLFPAQTKVLFLQNLVGLRRWLKVDDKEKSYKDIGYDEVMTCSQFCSDYVEKDMGIAVNTVTNGIDLTVFLPQAESRIERRILAMSRKNPHDLAIIQKAMREYGIDINVVDGLTQDELIKEYQAADIFIATGYPEGFSLPPIEAMACGAVVVGFTGGAGREFMIHRETALVAEDGDTDTVIEHLLTLINDSPLKERIRTEGLKKASEYGLDDLQTNLIAFYKKLSENNNI